MGIIADGKKSAFLKLALLKVPRWIIGRFSFVASFKLENFS